MTTGAARADRALCDSAEIATATEQLKAAIDDYARVAGLSQAVGTARPASAAELSAARRGIARAKMQLHSACEEAKSMNAKPAPDYATG
jgi:polysaccharide deacetylase 2 family uncharacterized protein YibQ